MPPASRPASPFAARVSHLRPRGGRDDSRVTYVELFYDLVFVFAVTQLSHGLLEHLTPLGAVQTAVLMLAMWWAWIDTAWITNWLNPERTAVRLMLFGLMLAGLVLAASIPKAFGDRALSFAVSYAITQVGRSLFMLWALKNHDAGNFLNFIRIVLWQGTTVDRDWGCEAWKESQARAWHSELNTHGAPHWRRLGWRRASQTHDEHDDDTSDERLVGERGPDRGHQEDAAPR